MINTIEQLEQAVKMRELWMKLEGNGPNEIAESLATYPPVSVQHEEYRVKQTLNVKYFPGGHYLPDQYED